MDHLRNLNSESRYDNLSPMNFGFYTNPLRGPLVLMILGAAFVRDLIVLMDFPIALIK